MKMFFLQNMLADMASHVATLQYNCGHIERTGQDSNEQMLI